MNALHKPPAPAADDLERSMSAVEQRLEARNQRVREGMRTLNRQVGQLAHRDTWLFKAGGVALAAGGALWVLRRRLGGLLRAVRHPRPAGAGSAPEAAAPVLLGMLPALVSWGWPMLPQRLRRWTTPGTAATLLGLAASWLQRTGARRPAGSRRAGGPRP